MSLPSNLREVFLYSGERVKPGAEGHIYSAKVLGEDPQSASLQFCVVHSVAVPRTEKNFYCLAFSFLALFCLT